MTIQATNRQLLEMTLHKQLHVRAHGGDIAAMVPGSLPVSLLASLLMLHPKQEPQSALSSIQHTQKAAELGLYPGVLHTRTPDPCTQVQSPTLRTLCRAGLCVACAAITSPPALLFSDPETLWLSTWL
jgi:hypothetical protein